MTDRIIVCGIYRSGTSLVTKLVREWGAYAGNDEDLFEDEFGYLEHLALQRFNDELLNNNSRVPTLASVLLEKLKDRNVTQQAHQILTQMDAEAQGAGSQAWVWKDPRIPLVLPFWSQLWQDAIYVIPVRHPVETIHSAAKMEGLSPEETPLSAGLAYWQFCMLNILEATQPTSKKIFIAYDELIRHPARECARLSEFLDAQCNLTSTDAELRVNKMAAHIQESQRHFQAPASLADLEVATAEQRALYNFLRVKTIYPQESYRADDFALYPGWLEYLQTTDALVSMMFAGRQE
jgi:hypothetical protein